MTERLNFLCAAPRLTVSPFSNNRTDGEVSWAKDSLVEIVRNSLSGYGASRANTIAAIMLPVIQPLVNLAPMAVFDKPQSGTGVSLLAYVISIVATAGQLLPRVY